MGDPLPPDHPALRPDRVSRNKKRAPASWSKPKIPMIRASKEYADVITCTCGWLRAHPRRKVREDAAQAHLRKRHGGQGVWL